MSAGLTIIMLAVVGTAGLTAAAYLFGFNKSVAIASSADAERLVRDYAPEAVPSDCVLSEDHLSALVACTQNSVFYVMMLGDSPVVRAMGDKDVTQVNPGKIRINVQDFGFPSRQFIAHPDNLKPILAALKIGSTR